MVMYIFRWHPEVIQNSLRSSMTYMYVPVDLVFDSTIRFQAELTRAIAIRIPTILILSIRCCSGINKHGP